MALDPASITSAAMSKLKANGFITDGEHSKQLPMVKAIVEAVVEGILTSAEVVDPGGTGPGKWPVT